jgi:hypothetical protein
MRGDFSVLGNSCCRLRSAASCLTPPLFSAVICAKRWRSFKPGLRNGVLHATIALANNEELFSNR